jgi:tetratricopeptide (TPR) repeat protein
VRAGTLIAIAVAQLAAAPPLALADPGKPAATAGVNAQAEVTAAIFAARATDQAIERGLDAELRVKRQHILALEAEVKAGRAARLELTHAQKQFTDELAAKDRAYAVEISAFRGAVEDIAKTPEGAKALAQFNSGDEGGALAVLKRLAAAREEGRQKRAAVEQAADLRRIAILALEARNRGKVSTADAIASYEEVTRIDPGLHWDWVTLCRLYRDAGRLADARRVAELAVNTASDEQERSDALGELGDVLWAQGDLSGAQSAFEKSLKAQQNLAGPLNNETKSAIAATSDKLGVVLAAHGELDGARKAFREAVGIRRDFVAIDSSSAKAKRNAAESAVKLGDVLKAQGDLAGARQAYQESLDFRRAVLATDLSSVQAKSDVSISLQRLGDVLRMQNDLGGARKAYEDALDTFQAVASVDPSNNQVKLDIAIVLQRLSEVLEAQGDHGGARKAGEESLTRFHSLVTARAGALPPIVFLGDAAALRTAHALEASLGGEARRDVAESLNKLGDVLMAQGDLGGALRAYKEGLTIDRALAAADPSSAEARRDVLVSLNKIGDVLVAPGDLGGGLKAYQEGLAIARALAAADPSSTETERDVMVSLNKIGDVLVVQGDLDGALKAYQEGLAIDRTLAAADPSSAEAKRDVAISLWKLASIPGSGVTWAMVVEALEAMDKAGALAPSDRPLLDEARTNAAQEARK